MSSSHGQKLCFTPSQRCRMHSLRNLGLRKWNRILLILIETCPTSNFGETGPYNLRRFQSWIRVTFMTSSTTTEGSHCPLPQQLQRGKPTPLPTFTLTFIRTILYLQDHLQRGSQSKTARAISKSSLQTRDHHHEKTKYIQATAGYFRQSSAATLVMY